MSIGFEVLFAIIGILIFFWIWNQGAKKFGEVEFILGCTVVGGVGFVIGSIFL